MAASVGSAPTDVNVNDRAHATAAPRRRSFELRVQEVAQRVPEQVHGKDRDGDRRPGEDDHPPRGPEGLGEEAAKAAMSSSARMRAGRDIRTSSTRWLIKSTRPPR